MGFYVRSLVLHRSFLIFALGLKLSVLAYVDRGWDHFQVQDIDHQSTCLGQNSRQHWNAWMEWIILTMSKSTSCPSLPGTKEVRRMPPFLLQAVWWLVKRKMHGFVSATHTSNSGIEHADHAHRPTTTMLVSTSKSAKTCLLESNRHLNFGHVGSVNCQFQAWRYFNVSTSSAQLQSWKDWIAIWHPCYLWPRKVSSSHWNCLSSRRLTGVGQPKCFIKAEDG